MVWFFSDAAPLKVGVVSPPPPPARGRDAPASGSGSAGGSYAPARRPNLVDWLQSSGSSHLSPVRDVRILDAKRSGDEMDTTVDQVTSGSEVVPWQLSEVPPRPRLLPGLLSYAEVIKKSTDVDRFEPIFTRPRPYPCLIHLDSVCQQCHLCIEYQLWSLEQKYAQRVPSIQFEGCGPADANGDVRPSLVAKYRPEHAPVEMKAPRDAELLYELRPQLKVEVDSATRQRSASASGSSVTFVPAEGTQRGAMLLLRGAIVRTGIHGGASAAEMGEGRLQPPLPPPDPRAKRLSVSPDDMKSDEEGVPERGTSAPPLSCNLTSAVSPTGLMSGGTKTESCTVVLVTCISWEAVLRTSVP